MSLRAAALVLCALCGLVSPAYATDYYLSPGGSDAASGTSPVTAWQTISRVNKARLLAGDRVLFEGGNTFVGNLVLAQADGGTPTSPLSIGSFGTGRATIDANSGDALFVYNRASVQISGLNVIGASAPDSSGIVFYTDAAGTTPLPFIRIEDVEVSGFGDHGIEIGAWNGAPGFSDVRIVRVSAHDNARTGILTYADRPNVHHDVYVGDTHAYSNPGVAGATTNTGSGIVLGSVDGGTVERSVAHDNGWRSTATTGPVGIWTYDSTRIVIQHNESYRNQTGGTADGGGFDLDQNVNASTLQFNYSHDNDGAGYLLAHGLATDGHRSNIVRFNISQDDGRKNGYGAIEVWGRVLDAAIYHNTVVISASTGTTPAAVRVHNAGIAGVRAQDVRILNNILYVRGAASLVTVSSDQLAANPVTFSGNDYYAASFAIRWGAASLSSLSAFRTLGQETVNGTATGIASDPGLVNADGGSTFDDAMKLESLDAYRLTASASARDHGVSLSLFGLSAGTADYFGASVVGVVPDIGASEFVSASGGTTAPDIVIWAADHPALHGNWTIVADATAAGLARIENPDRGAAKIATPSATPIDYVERTFTATAGVPYRLWIRAIAERNSFDNDSVYVQFSGSVTATGAPTYRIGTTSATTFVLENCSGCGVSGWGWQDNGYGTGVLGPVIYFATSGPQTIRLQTREDGIGIDQMVLSPNSYATTAPGATKHDTTILLESSSGGSNGSLEIVRWAADTPRLVGNWQVVIDSTAAGGARVANPDHGAPKLAAPLAAPADFFELTFNVVAGVPYRLWIRGKAQNNSYANDSVFVQFSGSVDAAGTAIFRIGSTSAATIVLEDCSGCGVSGWGWQDDGYGTGVLGPTISFATTGPQTVRFQPREDGLSIDQVVLSGGQYLAAAPGGVKNDSVILPR